MPRTRFWLWTVLLGLAAMGCSLTGVLFGPGAALVASQEATATPPPPSTQAATPAALPPTPTRTQPERAADAGSPQEATPAPTLTLAPRVQEQMARIEREVEEIRGLTASRPVEKVIITPEELARKVEEDFLADYSPEEAAQDAVELWLFGLTDRDTDLFEIHKTMLSEGIAGFYDDEEEKMYVVASDGFPPHARMTYAHEYTHALQDQTWDLDQGLGFNDETCDQDTEYCAGVQALIEGDATVTEYFWFFQKATAAERKAIQDYYDNLDMPGWDASPEFMQEDILFPYVYGQDFVLALLRRDGWDAVNAAYDDPPVSTEQIMHPERYPEDQPVRLTLPDLAALLGSTWEPITEQNALGEFWIYLMLAKSDTPAWRLDEDEAKAAAEGWGGDVYATYWEPDSGAAVLVQRWVWDTPDDAREFTDAFLAYAQARFGPGTQDAQGRWMWTQTPWGVVIFAPQGEQGQAWVIAPDRDLAERLYQALP